MFWIRSKKNNFLPTFIWRSVYAVYSITIKVLATKVTENTKHSGQTERIFIRVPHRCDISVTFLYGVSSGS